MHVVVCLEEAREKGLLHQIIFLGPKILRLVHWQVKFCLVCKYSLQDLDFISFKHVLSPLIKMTNYSVFIFQTNCTPHLPKADKGMHSQWFNSLTKLPVVFLPNYIVQIKQEFNNLKTKWKSNRRLLVSSFCISFEVTFHFNCNFFEYTYSIFVCNLYYSQTRLRYKLT